MPTPNVFGSDEVNSSTDGLNCEHSPYSIAGDRTADAVEFDGKHRVSQCLLADIEVAVLVGLGDVLDRLYGQHRAVIGVGVVTRDRRLVVGLLVLIDELGIILAHRLRRQIRVADDEANDRGTRCLDKVGRQQRTAAHQLGLLQPRRSSGLPDNLRRSSGEDGEVDQVRLFAGDACQQRLHIDVGRRDRFLRQHLAAHLLEVVSHHLLQLLRIWTAIVNGDHRRRLEDVVYIRRIRLALFAVAEHRARKAVIFWFARWGGERGSGAGGTDIDDPLLPENRRSGRGGGRTGRTKHDHGLRIGRQLGSRSLAAFGIAAIVLRIQLQRVAEKLASHVLERNLNAAFLVKAEGGVGTG